MAEKIHYIENTMYLENPTHIRPWYHIYMNKSKFYAFHHKTLAVRGSCLFLCRLFCKGSNKENIHKAPIFCVALLRVSLLHASLLIVFWLRVSLLHASLLIVFCELPL